ncbi:exodeoxyribonuclease V subunit alpha [Rahnella aceris]|jgi:exodeoxyribonuclease V alpha subunit|uniref:RecBCD enzyme subunit RecD n=1 Tax=Rahnella sp. (strain Y9602) TaxID=2703885 RepID=A0ABW6CG60_RAHSY|nr:exodeoxyribonuclease V subunit alpha [Rahnella aceris]AZP41203.1 exodeoxyribonuclease V subunit alpha [Rahnella aquatilis]AZP45544.1 exodeoxyribonuclease V subunit alpha [Rahnella aquatilis]NIA86729.1 exodeoxyribonuclease V subunit alpha [Rahnella aceris]
MKINSREDIAQLLASWVECGWLRELDRALVTFLAKEAPDAHPLLLLATALTSYQLGRGHVCLDLQATLDDSAFSLSLPPEGDHADGAVIRPAAVLDDLSLQEWLAALVHPTLVGHHEGNSPLVLTGQRLYLRRYWQYEQNVRAAIEQRLARSALHTLPVESLRAPLTALFPADAKSDIANWQKVACALAAGSAFSIITGGPGTGKTTTVVRLLALLQTLALEENGQPLRIRLAAPTGKAAARLNESIAGAVSKLDLSALGNGNAVRESINTDVVTLHRLLGSRPDTRHFRHHPGNPLMLDVLVVDEASMVDLEMMAALLAALPEQARLILLGDKDQLASVEAGALLSELCQRANGGHYLPHTRDWLQSVTGEQVPDSLVDPQGTAMDQAVVMLRHSYRFDAQSGIGQLAEAVNDGDVKALKQVWKHGYADLAQLTLSTDDDAELRDWVVKGGTKQFPAAARREGVEPPVGYQHYLNVMIQARPADNEPPEAFNRWAARVLLAYSQFQLLCALRGGRWGVEELNQRIADILRKEGLLKASIGWYPGRPVLVTRNDYSQRLMNGDIGITLEIPHRLADGTVVPTLRVAFLAGDGTQDIRWVMPGRLQAVETVFAMTVHKSQGSEFTHTALLLPENLSPILTRELIYTGITRARHWFSLGCVGGMNAVLPDAVKRRVLRASGLIESA